ncbi:hypothetical protein [Paraburkholderia youngii]|uniref:hypothetical protein n=1 Tax=Paraburkholderia youngii TaxID=2782701 RepID=UPI003D23768E
MNERYVKAEGPLLAAVQAAMRITGSSEEQMRAKREAEKAIIALCPYAIESVQEAKGHTFSGRHFKLESIEVVYNGMHYAAKGATSWSWLLRGPLILRTGKISRINSVRSYEEFHVEIPYVPPIPGDAGY